MRSILLSFSILMLISGASFAQDNQQKQAQEQSTQKVQNTRGKFNKPTVSRIRRGQYSRMFLSMIKKSRSLDLTKQQEVEIKQLQNSYLETLMSKENKSYALQRKFMHELQKADFNPETLKTITNETEEINEDIVDTFISSITEFRNIVGADKYVKLTPVTKIDRSALIKMRDEDLARVQKLRETELSNQK